MGDDFLNDDDLDLFGDDEVESLDAMKEESDEDEDDEENFSGFGFGDEAEEDY